VKNGALFWFGLTALGCVLLHAVANLQDGQPANVLWACSLGTLLVALGLLFASRTVNGVGTLFLCLGIPLWLLGLAAGRVFTVTSCVMHLGGLSLGLLGVRQLGLPYRIWWKAGAALAGVVLMCRLLTPAADNINAAYDVYPAEEMLPSQLGRFLVSGLVAVQYFFIAGFVLESWLLPGRRFHKGQMRVARQEHPPPPLGNRL
jgi:hypothetical protein